MILGRRVLALVPARGGSKRLPRKNVMALGGRPMIAWTVAAARASRFVDRVILSSDDPDIIAAAREAGCEAPFVRAPELATDAADSMDVIFDALAREGEGFDDLVLLQPTSPLRNAQDIDACVELRARTGAHSVVSYTALGKPANHHVRVCENGGLRRDGVFADGPGAPCVLNGAVYAVAISELLRSRSIYDATTLGYEMPAERSVDVDTAFDFALAQTLLDSVAKARA